MADSEKSQAAAGWPMLKGEYRTGSTESCVAVVTCGSHLDDEALAAAGAAISGSCKTENLGIEKLVSHIISNPNIRYLIVCGAEVKGHITGEAILMLHQNGISKNRIVGAKGAIPYIENLSEEAVKRFMEQIECIDMINVEDIGEISEKIKECIANDPGAFPAAPLIQDVKEKTNGTDGEESDEDDYEQSGTVSGGASVEEISSLTMITRLKSLDQKIAGIGDYHKFQAGFQAGKIEGFVIGFVLMILLAAVAGIILVLA
ncbi:tetrahydromethanopterin S-methyltransferase subunit A [Methanimicrococcus blatticola]|uniref:Tetrahydromethanopterin S-methyltransferase subunit A n=1 Tax=Methanimicrococcus blatticola TaxID=91560 RepID=A0A484F5X7_9EURY|nr:tetrahydromethanopterin S-methyltransferase subunit A [Methanimicrococcus blatticola]MBZ3936115.1 tetrahydromethanopterin S-methyltransferase subunit A [Methanimicrococcus blatticola]MCC2508358.1 tetrahydromethanopterin S-methyltransferase subunit A [Methanimicrococcus blatticola]TDQ70189.1 tetrahydromethanopterin S-methyltransferase subunit A [Methanimicrococcus blatticola]